MTTDHHLTTAALAAQSTLAHRFAAEAIPLREELLRVARRYTSNHHDAEDLVQETFTKAWVGFGSFDPGTNLRAWMFRIMVNTWISTHRKTLSRPQESLTDEFTDSQMAARADRATASPTAEDQALRGHIDDDLRQAIETLPAILRSTIYYTDICQLPHKEIALIADVPVGTVMSRVHRARQSLRNALRDTGRQPWIDRLDEAA